MKKLNLFILLFLLFPYVTFAETTANGTGSKVNWNGSSSGALGEHEYFLSSSTYGIRISFYSEAGRKLGKSIDAFDYKINHGKEIENKFIEVVLETKYGRQHAKLKNNGDSKSRIDYLNEFNGYVDKIGTFLTTDTNGKYYKYYDKGSLGFSANVNGYLVSTTCKDNFCTVSDREGHMYENDPLTYLNFGDRAYFKSYFTSVDVIKRYAKLANANINIGTGNYYILIEPIFYISSLNCDNYCGYYTATEIGFMYAKNNYFRQFFSEKNKKILFYDSLRLETAGEIGNYVFSEIKNTPTNDSLLDGTFLEKGYGMSIISGKEVCKENCSREHYQIVYHTIDLDDPFVDVNGETRELDPNNNWYNRRSVIDKYIYDNEPIITVTLTPSIIKSIRKDNKNVNYSSLNKDSYNVFYKKYQSIFQ